MESEMATFPQPYLLFGMSPGVFNTLTSIPAITGHATSILVGLISADCCSERGEKAVGQLVIKGTLRGEMKGLSFISPTTRSEEKRGNGADESIPQIN
ncbi:hypothetical protein AVEN_132811-1 [Araneus ventricosus]|uniref:Uncharacterized protein n=1 Tax=Araneus ventricosus TaxID=182803 RepID=A0A4Y2VAQ6_ARAVE|nr:hypothetical protein AVEN_132811-1 [Araneus ventricosus]